MEEDSELGIFFRPSQTKKKNSLWRVAEVDLSCVSEATRPQFVFFALYLLIYFPFSLVCAQDVFYHDGGMVQRALQYAQLAAAFSGLLLLIAAIILEHEFFYIADSSKVSSYCTLGCGAAFVSSFVLLAVIESIVFERDEDSLNWTWHGSFALSMLMFVPLALLLGAPSLKSRFIWLSFFVCLVAKVTLAAIVESTPDIVAAAAQCIICASVIHELRRERNEVRNGAQGDMMTFASQQILEHDMNVKHMVANVAHDLKTPVSSFMAGVEGISQSLRELTQSMDKMVDSEADLISRVKEFAEVIGNYVGAMRNTNSFMFMTINRCIDYTKASKGLKLVPKYETIDLMETLSLPLNCMKDIQQRVVIRMEPLPSNLCSHIITDKQWLQENVLCLLSNAVKYSSEGYVAVSVRLEGGNSPDAPVRRSFVAVDSPSSHRSRGSPAMSTRKSSRIAPHPSTYSELQLEGVEGVLEPASTRDATQASDLRFEIEDTGIGMSEEAMANLFSPFRQNQSLAGGTGLGLFSLAKRIEALHGKCGVQRRRDGKQGSLFWFTVPYRPDHAALSLVESPLGDSADSLSLQGVIVADHSMSYASLPTPHGVSKGSSKTLLDGYRGLSPPSITIHGRSLNILIVDDSPVIVRMTSMMLKRCGYSVTSADNGAEALKLIMEEHEQRRGGRAERRPRFNSAVSDDMADILHVGSAAAGEDEPEGKFVVRESLADPFDARTPLFDVILMDLQMPIMDGLEATRRLREWEHQQQQLLAQSPHSPPVEAFFQLRSSESSSPGPITFPAISTATIAVGKEGQDEADAFFSLDDVPFVSGSLDSGSSPQGKFHHFVLGVSANCEEETVEEAKMAGFDAFISKPFNLDTFHQILRTHRKYLPLK